MKKSTRIVKRVLALFLIVLMSINTFGAVVSDNDGSAFITKAEFDSLKNDFQSQIDQYNTSIDAKIDGAIAAYLAGIRLSKKSIAYALSAGYWDSVGGMVDTSDKKWRYEYGSPMIAYYQLDAGKATGVGSNVLYVSDFIISAPTYDATKHAIKKMSIADLDKTARIAAWNGVGYGTRDTIVCYGAFYGANTISLSHSNIVYVGLFRPNQYTRKNNGNFSNNTWYSIGFNFDDSNLNAVQWESSFNVDRIEQEWGNIKNKKLILFDSGRKYMNFSLYPNSENLNFYTTDTALPGSYEQLWTTDIRAGQRIPSEFLNAIKTSGTARYIVSGHTPQVWEGYEGATLSFSSNFGGAGRSYWNDAWGLKEPYYFTWPCVGFEEDYITNWNQLYLKDFDSIVAQEAFDGIRDTYFLRGSDGNYHVGLRNGLPITNVSGKNLKLTLDIELLNSAYDKLTGSETYSKPTETCYVWVSNHPFKGYPNDEDCLTFDPINSSCQQSSDSKYNKAIEIPAENQGKASATINVPNGETYIWVKWSTNGDSGGGCMVIPKTFVVEESE